LQAKLDAVGEYLARSEVGNELLGHVTRIADEVRHPVSMSAD
jgi:hypothetical protein